MFNLVLLTFLCIFIYSFSFAYINIAVVYLLAFYSELLLQFVVCYICLTLGNQKVKADIIVQLFENQDGTFTERVIRKQSLMVEAKSVQRETVNEEKCERVLDEIV